MTSEEREKLMEDLNIAASQLPETAAYSFQRSVLMRARRTLIDTTAALREESARLDAIERGGWAIEPVEGNVMPAGSFAVWHNTEGEVEPDIGKSLREAIDIARRGDNE